MGSVTPRVSIVTPVLDRVDTIAHCLRSVMRQSFEDLEHILVDGGSTDGTIELVRSFEGQYPLKWISGPDEGMYDAINKGLQLASGDVIAYLNSDDLYLPWSVEVAVSALGGGSDIVFGDLGVLKLGQNAVFYPQFYRPFDLNFYTHVGTLAQPTVFWNRSVTQRIGGFDSSYRLLGDCDYWIRAALAGSSFRHLDEILAIQVEHEGTLRAVHPEKLAEEFVRLRTEHEEAAGPARRLWLRKLGHKVRWRRNQFRFVLASRKRAPRRWRHFTSFLKEQQIEVSVIPLLWFLLPEFLRPRTSSLLDAEALTERLYGSETRDARS